jgi:hypothetical protein
MTLKKRAEIAKALDVHPRTIKRRYKPDARCGKFDLYDLDRILAEAKAEAEARQKAKAPAA